MGFVLVLVLFATFGVTVAAANVSGIASEQRSVVGDAADTDGVESTTHGVPIWERYDVYGVNGFGRPSELVANDGGCCPEPDGAVCVGEEKLVFFADGDEENGLKRFFWPIEDGGVLLGGFAKLPPPPTASDQ